MREDTKKLQSLLTNAALQAGDPTAMRQLLDGMIEITGKHAAEVPALADALDKAQAISETFDKVESIGAEIKALLADMAKAEAEGDQARVAELASRIEVLSAERAAASDAIVPDDLRPETYPAPYQALRDALDVNDEAEIERLLATGLDLNGFTCRYGNPPLFWALHSEDRNAATIGRLIAAGADATFTTSEGYNALHMIGDHSFGERSVEELTRIVALLVSHGAQMEARTHWGWTPLYRAVFEGSTIEMEALLGNGADPNAPPVDVDAPGCAQPRTMLCAAGYEVDKVRLLLAHGADPSASLAGVAVDAAEAVRLLTEEAASGRVAAFHRDYAEGYRQSLDLLRRASGLSSIPNAPD